MIKPEIQAIIDSLRVGESATTDRMRKPAGKLKKLPKPEMMPNNFTEFRGQTRVKTILMDTITAATKQGKSIDHILLSGLPGQGKTTLAWLVANHAKRPILTVTAGAIEKPIDIYNIFREVEKEIFPIIFIDEIHALRKGLAELLYIPMEAPNTQIHFPSMYGTVNLSITVPAFTLVGATAGEVGKLPKPLLDRIHLKINMDPYRMEDLISIVVQSGRKLDLNVTEGLAKELAQRSSLIPRKANNLLRIVKNFTVSRDISRLTHEVLGQVFELMEIDELGIDRIGRQILSIIADSNKGCIGLKSLASMIGTDEQTLTQLYEPELIALGLIRFMPRGRAITELGVQYLERMERNG